MEIKLLVRTHKKKFGSVLMFSHNISPREKKIMEDIRYTGYEPDDSQIVEVISSGHYIYFCTYIGGQDEFGRDYQNVIAAIFPFKLSDSDILNLRKTIRDIMKDIAGEAFLEENRYFAEIKNRNSISKNTQSVKNLKINYPKFILTSFSIILILFLLFFITMKFFNQKIKTSKPLEKIESNIQHDIKTEYNSPYTENFNKFKLKIASAKNAIEKYEAYLEYIEVIQKEADKYKEEADNSFFDEIKTLNSSNPNSEEVLKKIDNYFNKYKFSLHSSEVELLKNPKLKEEEKNSVISLDDVYNKVDVYNKDITSASLNSVIKSCKNALDFVSESEKIKIKKILNQANQLTKSINTEVEIYIYNKSSVFNRKTFSFEISVDNDDYQSRTKALNSDKDIYAGSFFVNISPRSSINFKIFDYSYDGKRHLLKDMKFDFDDLNTQKLVTDSNGNSFQIELKTIKDKFKIKK